MNAKEGGPVKGVPLGWCSGSNACGELLFIWKGGYECEDVLDTQHFPCTVARPGLGSGCQNPSENSKSTSGLYRSQ